jgi:hypothetical protein
MSARADTEGRSEAVLTSAEIAALDAVFLPPRVLRISLTRQIFQISMLGA